MRRLLRTYRDGFAESVTSLSTTEKVVSAAALIALTAIVVVTGQWTLAVAAVVMAGFVWSIQSAQTERDVREMQKRQRV